MKLAALLLALAVVPGAAQRAAAQHGHRLGSGLIFLTESPDVPEPPDRLSLYGAPPELLQAARDPSVTLSAEQMAAIRALGDAANRASLEAKANSTGTDFPFMNNRDGSKTPFLFSSRPSAAFDTWALQRTSDYAESAKTGFAAIERTEGRAILRRFVRDDLRHIYISYAATVETLADGTYRVSFGPSGDEAPADVSGKVDWTLVSPAKIPVPQIMQDGDSIALELYSPGLQSNALSRKLVDYVHVGRQDRMGMRTDAPGDSYAEDAELTVTQPRVRVNGVASAVAALPETLRGPVLWIYVPGHGRYVLSLRPHPDLGFEGTGEAAGDSLTFAAADGNVFHIDTSARVASGSGSYIVNVLADPSWEPADPKDRGRVTIGSQMTP